MLGVRLIIADDDARIRNALRTLADELGAEVVAEADNGRSAIEQAERHGAQVILLDVSMPIMGGFPAARYLRDHLPSLRVILVSQYNQRVYAEEALEVGAKGYIVKSAAASELEPALQTVMEGGTFVSARIGD
jgi:DNA-binding NarL/FixJ family response regulator